MLERRPNILFIITDQQYAGAMSCAGNPDVYTPNMDSLAETGVRFTRAYCTHPLCGPQRASFMTGLFPHQNGAISNNTPINPEYKGRTLGNLLADAGYDCALSGKWHVPGTTPAESGLEVICGNRDDEVPLRSIEFMQRDRDNPFFLFASFLNPHDICQVARNQPLPQGPVPEPATVEECPNLPANFAIPPYSPDILQMLRQANRRGLSHHRIHRRRLATAAILLLSPVRKKSMLKSACCSMACATSALKKRPISSSPQITATGTARTTGIKKPASTRKSSTFLLSSVTKGSRRPVALTIPIWSPLASICCPRCAMLAMRVFPMALKG